MNEIALAEEDAVHGVSDLPPDLAHPQPVGGGGQARDLDFSGRQIEEEEHDKSWQPLSRPHFDREEVRGDNEFPVSREKLLPGRLAAALGCGLEAMPCEDRGHGAAGHLVPEMRQRALDPAIPPVAILFGQTYHQSLEGAGNARAPRPALGTAVVLLGDPRERKFPGASAPSGTQRQNRKYVLPAL